MSGHERILKRLADRAAGCLSPGEEAKLSLHLAQCVSCQAEAQRFEKSFQALAGALTGVVSPPLQSRVLNQVARKAPGRFEFGWRSIWAGTAVLTAVMLFSVYMAQPGITNQQVLQAYGDDVQSLWEGGGTDSYNTWMQDSWNEGTWLEQAGASQSEKN
jgi:anti-sigma factor RsiW